MVEELELDESFVDELEAMMAEEDETFDVETAMELELALSLDNANVEDEDVPALQPNWISLICHVAVVLEKPLQMNAVIAFRFAPVKELKGTVIVCVEPVRPVMV